jgi:hypothetical protein
MKICGSKPKTSRSPRFLSYINSESALKEINQLNVIVPECYKARHILSPNGRTWYRANNVCTFCWAPGHAIENCTNPHKQPFKLKQDLRQVTQHETDAHPLTDPLPTENEFECSGKVKKNAQFCIESVLLKCNKKHFEPEYLPQLQMIAPVIPLKM